VIIPAGCHDGCITYDFDDNPFTIRMDEGVKDVEYRYDAGVIISLPSAGVHGRIG
jgi:hypothetical protein